MQIGLVFSHPRARWKSQLNFGSSAAPIGPPQRLPLLLGSPGTRRDPQPEKEERARARESMCKAGKKRERAPRLPWGAAPANNPCWTALIAGPRSLWLPTSLLIKPSIRRHGAASIVSKAAASLLIEKGFSEMLSFPVFLSGFYSRNRRKIAGSICS